MSWQSNIVCRRIITVGTGVRARATTGCRPDMRIASPITLWRRKHLSRACEKYKNGKGERGTYAERQVENYDMRVKVLVVIAMARVHRERRGWLTPSRVRRECFSPALGNLRWDAGAVSRPEPDLNATISRSRHNIISSAIEVKGSAVGEGTVELHPAPLIAADRGVAVAADGSSTGSFSRYEKKKEFEGPECAHENGDTPRLQLARAS